MRIGVNLIPYADIQGIEIFTQNILFHLPSSEADEIFLFTNWRSTALFPISDPRIKIVEVKIKKLNRLNLLLAQQFKLGPLVKKYKLTTLFCPSLSIPLLLRKKIVVIHDLAFLNFRDESGLFGRIYLRLAILSAKYLSQKILTVSEFSKQEISRRLKIKTAKIINIGEGCPVLPLTGPSEDTASLKKFGLAENKYFIYIGNVRPRKNLKNIILAWQKFNALNDYQYYFVIAGKKDRRCSALEAWAAKLNIQNLIFTGFLSQKEKVSLLKKSLGLLFISLYEGFGLPILEAQFLNVPVIASTVSSLPETAGAGGALLADPLNIKEIADKINLLAHDELIRQKLIAVGRLNSRKYSWVETARQIRAAIKDFTA